MLSLWKSFQETFKMSQLAQRGNRQQHSQQLTISTWSNVYCREFKELCAPGCHTTHFSLDFLISCLLTPQPWSARLWQLSVKRGRCSGHSTSINCHWVYGSAVAGQLLSVHYHSSISFYFHEAIFFFMRSAHSARILCISRAVEMYLSQCFPYPES